MHVNMYISCAPSSAAIFTPPPPTKMRRPLRAFSLLSAHAAVAVEEAPDASRAWLVYGVLCVGDMSMTYSASPRKCRAMFMSRHDLPTHLSSPHLKSHYRTYISTHPPAFTATNGLRCLAAPSHLPTRPRHIFWHRPCRLTPTTPLPQLLRHRRAMRYMRARVLGNEKSHTVSYILTRGPVHVHVTVAV